MGILDDAKKAIGLGTAKKVEEPKKPRKTKSAKEIATEQAKAMIKKYNEQQKNVRNNRAFESLSKEIEFQELEIELCAKQSKELQAQIELKNQSIEENTELKNIETNLSSFGFLRISFNLCSGILISPLFISTARLIAPLIRLDKNDFNVFS